MSLPVNGSFVTPGQQVAYASLYVPPPTGPTCGSGGFCLPNNLEGQAITVIDGSAYFAFVDNNTVTIVPTGVGVQEAFWTDPFGRDVLDVAADVVYGSTLYVTDGDYIFALNPTTAANSAIFISGSNGFSYCYELAVDRSGLLYIVDVNDAITVLNSQGQLQLSITGYFQDIAAVAAGVNEGVFYVADYASHGMPQVTIGSLGGGGWYAEAVLDTDTLAQGARRECCFAAYYASLVLQALAVDADGNLYVYLYVDCPYEEELLGVIQYYFVVLSPTGELISQNDLNFEPHPVFALDGEGQLWGNTGTQLVVQAPYVAILDAPGGLAMDASGNTYIADYDNSRIMYLNAAGVLQGIYFDSFYFPSGVALDSQGNLYVADTYNARIVVLSADGTVQNVFDDGFAAVHGVAMDASGNIYVVDESNNRIVVLSSSDSAVNAYVYSSDYYPLAVAVDPSNNLYIAAAQGSTYVVDHILSSGGLIREFDDSFEDPMGLAVDIRGNLYVADTDNARIDVYNSFGEQITTLTDGLLQPAGVVVNASGYIFVVDQALSKFIQLPPAVGLLAGPFRVAIDSAGVVYVADVFNNRIVKQAPNGVLLDVFTAGFSYPYGVAVDREDNIYVADLSNDRVVILSASGAVLRNITGFLEPTDVAVDAAGNIYVCEFGNNRILKLYADDENTVYFTHNLTQPVGVALDSTGNMYVADTGNSRIVVLHADGTLSYVLSDGFDGPFGVTVDSTGAVYVADSDNNRIVVLSKSSVVVATLTDGFNQPTGVAVNSQGTIYVADYGNNRVVELSAEITPQSSSSSSSSSNSSTAVRHSSSSSSTAAVRHSSSSTSTTAAIRHSSSSSSSTAAIQHSSSSSSSSSHPLPPPVTASLCLLLYSLPGNPDFPWSSAVQLTLQYTNATVVTSSGSAVQVIGGTGTRTYTNKFGHSTTVNVTVLSADSSSAGTSNNLLYLNSALPFDASGITLRLSVNVTLPGYGPLASFGQLRYYLQTAVLVNTTNTTATYITEDASSRIDPTGSAFLSSVPGFHNITLGGGNANIGAVKYATCQAPITFANGQRAPINPSFANGGKTIQYNYFVSDGATYSITTNLTLTTDGAVANAVDALGNQYQNIIGVTGTRVYRYLPTNQIVSSTVSGLSSYYATADQRFYPFALLGSGAGIYTINTAPFVDYDGIEFNISPAAPAAGLPPGQGTQYTATSVYTESRELSPVLVDGYLYPSSGLQVSGVGTGVPLQSLQQQQYARLTSS